MNFELLMSASTPMIPELRRTRYYLNLVPDDWYKKSGGTGFGNIGIESNN